MTDIIPLVSIAVAALFGIITYAWQEFIRRRNALAERRKELYENWIRNLIELLAAKTEKRRSELITEIEKGWLFSSDAVLKAAYDYLELYDSICCSHIRGGQLGYEDVLAALRGNEETRQEVAERLARVFLGMRQDIRRETKIEERWAIEKFKLPYLNPRP